MTYFKRFLPVLLVLASFLLLSCSLSVPRKAPTFSRPDKRASLADNFDLVGADVKRRFPEITETGHYLWDNGYIMSFEMKGKDSVKTRAYARDIVVYAYPEWVTIRRWAGFPEAEARECEVFVTDKDGTPLATENASGLH
jgi:hypothetical protein